jgi:hypothetical protein
VELGLAEPLAVAVAVPVGTEFCGLAEPEMVTGTLAPADAPVPVGEAVLTDAEIEGRAEAEFWPFGSYCAHWPLFGSTIAVTVSESPLENV